MKNYDVIVIGGGHAGTEAALAAARMNAQVLLITHSVRTIGQMSCNPAIGGIGKSHLVKEIDALGGLMARAADHAGIQFRILNTTKGAAVHSTRAQIDRALYRGFVQEYLANAPNLDIFEGAVARLLIQGGRVCGACSEDGSSFVARSVVLTAGTFLSGKIYIGQESRSGGRVNDKPSISLAKYLSGLNLRVGRLKTGTPPRIAGDSINFEGLLEQKGDLPVPVMSFVGNASEHPPQRSCFVTHTNVKTHQIVRDNLHNSPMVRKFIKGVGPRYCPSIEDKVVKFADRNAHQIFIEPEGLNSEVWYPNGISTSLDASAQEQMVHSIRGFEKARITQYGYAIEYDYFDPRDLSPTLETNSVEALFFAGQVNGTTGYEEAAAQGILAGINAALHARDQDLVCFGRSEAYIGVLVDDLSTNGLSEPYRIFTSRAEYRLMLREDNADLRLTPRARELGLIDDRRWAVFNEKYERIEREKERLRRTRLSPDSAIVRRLVQSHEDFSARGGCLLDLLKRPEIRYSDLQKVDEGCVQDTVLAKQIEADTKYDGYIRRQQSEIERLRRGEHIALPSDLDYQSVHGLSYEARHKLENSRPATLGQARRISGVTPATLSALLLHLKKNHGLAARA